MNETETPTTRILTCTCDHDGQDRIYGKGRRVHNLMATGEYRCTVCLTKRRP